jgi:hypothetical protein
LDAEDELEAELASVVTERVEYMLRRMLNRALGAGDCGRPMPTRWSTLNESSSISVESRCVESIATVRTT